MRLGVGVKGRPGCCVIRGGGAGPFLPLGPPASRPARVSGVGVGIGEEAPGGVSRVGGRLRGPQDGPVIRGRFLTDQGLCGGGVGPGGGACGGGAEGRLQSDFKFPRPSPPPPRARGPALEWLRQGRLGGGGASAARVTRGLGTALPAPTQPPGPACAASSQQPHLQARLPQPAWTP